MINKYQEAFDFISDSQFADYYPRETEIIKEALQAGAEGRILQWQPIENAPKDGTRIIVTYYGCFCVVYFKDNYWRETITGMGLRKQPKYWMPLPPQPEDN